MSWKNCENAARNKVENTQSKKRKRKYQQIFEKYVYTNCGNTFDSLPSEKVSKETHAKSKEPEDKTLKGTHNEATNTLTS